MDKPKVLIIKLGYSETLDAEISRVTSLGDVLRTTVVLHQFRDYHVTWLVDEKAYELIENNPFIHRPLIYDLNSALQLQAEHFDIVINFEKVPGVCAFADRIRAWKRYGFAFDPVKGEAISRDGSERVFSLCRNIDEKRSHNQPWQKLLMEMIGGEWKEQEYILGYEPKSKLTFDFGFNHVVGAKWPTKAWPESYWKSLSSSLEGKGFSVSWQQGLANLKEYADWINSCRCLITTDSLGFHLALALKRNTIVIYGPTNSNETYMYGRGVSLRPQGFECAPCLSASCTNERFCMEAIQPERVLAEVLKRYPAPGAETTRAASGAHWH